MGWELFSGMFEQYPNVKLIHSMLGGEFFTQRPAIRLAHQLTGSGK